MGYSCLPCRTERLAAACGGDGQIAEIASVGRPSAAFDKRTESLLKFRRETQDALRLATHGIIAPGSLAPWGGRQERNQLHLTLCFLFILPSVGCVLRLLVLQRCVHFDLLCVRPSSVVLASFIAIVHQINCSHLLRSLFLLDASCFRFYLRCIRA